MSDISTLISIPLVAAMFGVGFICVLIALAFVGQIKLPKSFPRPTETSHKALGCVFFIFGILCMFAPIALTVISQHQTTLSIAATPPIASTAAGASTQSLASTLSTVLPSATAGGQTLTPVATLTSTSPTIAPSPNVPSPLLLCVGTMLVLLTGTIVFSSRKRISAANPSGNSSGAIKYGDLVALRHVVTKRWLAFADKESQLSRTSNQHLVTTTQERTKEKNYWRVKPPFGESKGYEDGKPVQSLGPIRLEHTETRLFLHSHGRPHRSPLSQQQEVTAFGNTDVNDDWQVDLEDATMGFWKPEKPFRLIHRTTRYPLHAHSQYEGEVTCHELGYDDNDLWIAERVSQGKTT